MFLLTMRGLLLGLIIGCLLGCGADEASSQANEIPVVTIELIGLEDDGVSFRLSIIPTPANDLAVLIETEALGPFGDDYEIGYTWLMVPRFSNTRDFKFDLDTSVPWEVRVLPLAGRDLNTYPIEGTKVPVGFEFKQYRLGGTPSVTTERNLPAQLLVEWPDTSSRLFSSTPANATLTFIFDILPEDLIVSQGRVGTDGNVVTVEGPFPLGDFSVELSWHRNLEHHTWYDFVTEPDFEPPKIVQVWASSPDLDILLWSGLGVEQGEIRDFKADFEFIRDNIHLPPDIERIQFDFNEEVWFHEQITGLPDIQTENGIRLRWEAKQASLFEGERNQIILSLLDGEPLKPQTTYVVLGIVTDLANETEIKLTFTTVDR